MRLVRKAIGRFAAILVLTLTVCTGFPVPQTGVQDIDAFVGSTMAEWKIPGLAVAAVKDGQIIVAKGYGFRDVEGKLPVTSRTLFAIGSNSKSFTVTVLGMLNDEGKIDWDKPVREYLPDFRLYDPVATEQMTPRDLVCHRSGLPRHDMLWFATGLKRKELYERLRFLQPNRPFRSAYQYQNLMFMTAGWLEEKITGRRWEDLVRERILQPLGMQRSNFSVVDMQKDGDFSYPYAELEGKVRRIPYRNIDEIGPAGSINSSVQEMIRYVQFHIDLGKQGDKQLLSQRNARQMQTPQMVQPPPTDSYPELGPSSYGLGLMITTYRGRRLVSHGGGIDGFISQMAWLPDDKIGVVVLSNLSGTNPAPDLVTRHTIDRLLGLEPVDWAGRARAQQKRAANTANEARKRAAAEKRAGTSPSHPLPEYCGTYAHPAFGKAEVLAEGSGLQVKVVGFTIPLEHFHYDIFAAPESLSGPALGIFRGRRVTFLYNNKGEIDRIAVPLEPAVADIIFTRMADTQQQVQK
jgi:CubicO group peptidase (beta-lactamase class C family)